jgi:hypothetical protein
MFGYMFAHEAHHRGQVIMLAHQLGYRLPVEAWAGIWWWDKLWKQCGFDNGQSDLPATDRSRLK